MHKLLNFFCFPFLILGCIVLSKGLLGYSSIYEINFKKVNQNSIEINNLYSEKEITLKDPPISETLTNKLIVKIKAKPLNPKIVSRIKNKDNLNQYSNLSDNDFDYLSARKKQFVKTILPIIINENQNIIITRNFVNNLRDKLMTFKTLNSKEVKELNKIAKKFKIKHINKHKLDLVNEILSNVDVIPNSIALAQAALESGWGKSRFAQEYNALFGEKHLIKSFSSYDNSVSSYFRNINSHNAYKDFRAVRQLMRSKNNFSNISLLISNLHSYAEDSNYINNLEAVIQKNNFTKFDTKIISF